jgi:hypothetical protein
MIRRILCLLGWHEWILIIKFTWSKRLNDFETIGRNKMCKHCGKVKK